MSAVEKPLVTPQLVEHSAGERLFVIGEEITVKLSSADTNGEFSLLTESSPPGGGPPPHVHANEDETFIITEGEFEFLIGTETRRARPGDVVFGPRNVPHTFKNASSTPSRMYVLCTPAGLENFFRRVDREIGPGAPDIPKLLAIAGEHGLTFLT